MESIIASGPSDDNPKQHVFLGKWKDLSQGENTWETYENVMNYDSRLMEDYYKRNSAVEKDRRFKDKGKTVGKRKQRI